MSLKQLKQHTEVRVSILISILLSMILVILIIPARQLFPSSEFKKVAHILNDHPTKKQNVVLAEKSILDKIASLGYKLMKIFNMRVPVKQRVMIESKLVQAGLTKRFSIESFFGLKIGMIFVGGLFGILLATMTDVQVIKWICYSVCIVCFFWPNMWLDNTIKTRRFKIQQEMPFVLSSIAIITESGQSLLKAISEVSSIREGALVEEFQVTILEIEMGFTRVDALMRMMDRIQVTELSMFLSSLTQSIEKGSSGIAELLKKQSAEMWLKRKENAKELAEKASIKLFLPLLLFVLPAMMIFLLTPAVLSLIGMM